MIGDILSQVFILSHKKKIICLQVNERPNHSNETIYQQGDVDSHYAGPSTKPFNHFCPPAC